MSKPKVASAGGIRYIEYRFPSARDARRFIQDNSLEERYDLSARINVDPPQDRRDLYKKARGAVYVPVWAQENSSLRLMTRLLRKESEIVGRMTETSSVVLRVAERTDSTWRLVADGVTKRRGKVPRKPAKLEDL